MDGQGTVIPIRAKFQRKSLITLKEEGNLFKADRGVGKNISAYIHQQTGTLIPVGSGTVGLIIVLYTYKLLRLSVKKLYKVYDS